MKLIRSWNRSFTILDRYLINEFFGPFILGIFGFAVIAVVDILFYLVELTVISGVPIFIIFRLLMFKLPAIMILFFPMAVLFATMLVLVRMAKDNEVTILKASGIPTIRFIIPFIIMCFSITVLSYFTNEKLVPWTNYKSDILIKQQIKKQPPPQVIENTVFNDNRGRHFYVKAIDSNKKIMRKIIIYEETGSFPRFILANKGVWNDKKWTLLNGKIIDFTEKGDLNFIDKFNQFTIHVDQNIQSFYQKQKSANEMDSRELKEKIDIFNKSGISTRNLKVEYYLKYSIPAACFVFGIIGIAYCLTFVKTGKDWWGVIFSICLAVVTVGFYFFLVALCRALGKDGKIVPMLSAWLPNIVYLSIGICLVTYQSYKK